MTAHPLQRILFPRSFGDAKQELGIAGRLFVSVYLISILFFKPDLSYARFVFLTKAIVHFGTTALDAVEIDSGLSTSEKNIFREQGYLGPSPGLAIFGVATYWPYTVIVQPEVFDTLEISAEQEFRLSQFVMSLSTVALFTSLTVSLFFLWLRAMNIPEKRAVFFSLLLFGGTPIVFYALNLTNGQNILEMAWLFISYFILRQVQPHQPKWVWFSGFCAGLAVFVNLSAILMFPLLILVIYTKLDTKIGIWWFVGVVSGCIPLLLYDWLSFGNLLPSYSLEFNAGIPFLDLVDAWKVARDFLVSPRIGLIFYCPQFLILIYMLRHVRGLRKHQEFRIILIGCTLYLIGISLATQAFRLKNDFGDNWYLIQGGGGPRYLLPIVPFLLGAVASMEHRIMTTASPASILGGLAMLINTPGLFWTGGQALFVNNFLLFLKNGYHSYMIDEIQVILNGLGINVNNFSLLPVLTVLAVVLWWLWHGLPLRSDLLGKNEGKL